MFDLETDLDAQIFALFIRQHDLRIRLRQIGEDANADWETLHQKLDRLNDHRIQLARQVEEADVEEWMAMSEAANAISRGCDQLESSLAGARPTCYSVELKLPTPTMTKHEMPFKVSSYPTGVGCVADSNAWV